MILESGSKVLVVHRRLFENDHSRYFVGVVDAYEHGVAKVRGNTWMRDPFTALFVKKEDFRTKLVAIASGTLLVYELPRELDLAAIDFVTEKDSRLVLTDRKSFRADLSETEHAPQARGKRR